MIQQRETFENDGWLLLRAWLRFGALCRGVFVFVALFFLFSACPGLAHDISVAQQFLFRKWDQESGIPAGGVGRLAKTPDGYLWLATGPGLLRFDGLTFVLVNGKTDPELGPRSPWTLMVDSTGSLWVGMDTGVLARRTGQGFVRIPSHPKLETNAVVGLAEGREGVVWVGYRGGMTSFYKDGQHTLVELPRQPQGAASGMRMIRTASGDVFGLCDGILYRVEKERWAEMPGQGMFSGRIVALSPARDGGLWVAADSGRALGGRGGRIIKYREGRFDEEIGNYIWSQDTVKTSTTTLLEDSSGQVWVGTDGAGVYVWNRGDGWHELTHEGSLSQLVIRCLLEDDEGSIWAGLKVPELHRVRQRPVVPFSPPAAAKSAVLTSCAAQDGSIWMGTDGAGAYRLTGRTWEHFTTNDGLPSAHIGVILEDSKTNLWVGTWGGVVRREGARFVPVGNDSAFRQVVLTLFEDNEGGIWCGTGAGVAYLKDGAEEVFGRDRGIPHFYIRAITQDRAGTIWVAIMDRGLFRLKNGRFEHYGAKQWSGEILIRGLHPDNDGSLWILTQGAGLFHLKDGRFRQWASGDGLPHSFLGAVAEDAHGTLWFTSEDGVFGCPKARLLEYEKGKSPPILFRQLSTSDGLEVRMCSGAGQPVISISADGRLWFPNWHVLSSFHPDELPARRRPAPVNLEEVVVGGSRVRPDSNGTIRISTRSGALQLNYSSPDLIAADRLRYRVQMKGIDPDWVDAGTLRSAHYRQLQPGEYSFHAMAGGQDGSWTLSRALLKVEVIPEIWERAGVRAFAVVALLGVFAGGVWRVSRRRLEERLAAAERQRALEQERIRIARDMHDELGARVTQIGFLSALAASDSDNPAEVQAQNAKISEVARDLARSLDEIVWAVRPQNNHLASLVEYLGQTTRGICEGTPLRCWFSVPAEVPFLSVSASVRHNLVLACREAVNNALKHSGATGLRMGIAVSDLALTIEIADNGTGFDPDLTDTRRSGIQHMEQRMKDIKGSFLVESFPGKGTRITLTLLLKNLVSDSGA